MFDKYLDSEANVVALNKGLTNKSYIMDDKFIGKVYANHVDNYEVLNTHLVSKYDVPVIHIDNEVKISLMIDGKTYEDKKYDQKSLITLARTLKSLHADKIVTTNVFNPQIELNKYLSGIEVQMYDYSQYNTLIEDVMAIWNKADKVLCHNDLVAGNILFANKMYLIDWEYSGMNDPLFDVASFLNENNLWDTQASKVFLTWYFENMSDETFKKVSIYNDFQNLLWTAWANMMFDKTGNEIFKDIAKDKFSKLKK